VDIKSETQLAEEESRYGEEWAEGEWVENDAGEMVWQPAEGGEAVSATEWSRVVAGDESETPKPDDPKPDEPEAEEPTPEEALSEEPDRTAASASTGVEAKDEEGSP
jgi:hypothetical protein